MNLFNRIFSKQLFKEWQRGYAKGLEQEKLPEGRYLDLENYWKGRVDKLVADKFASESYTVNPTDIIYASPNGLVFLGKEQITPDEVKQLKEEVKAIKHFRLWQIIDQTIRLKAIEKAMRDEDAETVSVNPKLLAGKMMLLNLKVIQDIINTVDKIK